MESEKIFEILFNFEQDKNEFILLEELKKIYAEEIKCSFEAPNENQKNQKNQTNQKNQITKNPQNPQKFNKDNKIFPVKNEEVVKKI